MTGVLAAERVSFAYGARAVLRDVDVAVAPGEIVGVIGPNGSGKTTLVRVLSGVVAPASGVVRLRGVPLRAHGRRELARRLAVVPQDPVLDFPFTALEVVLMGRAPHLPPLGFPRAHDLAVARAAMARLDVASLEDRPLDRVSGGERQRVLLARALAQDADVLLLDEPTAHLDLRHQAGIHDVVRELARTRGIAVLSVLHDLNLAALYCDRLVLLAGGAVARAGRPGDVLTPDALRAAFSTDVYVGVNPLTGGPIVLPRPSEPGVAQPR
jgi:iron complex transport system ATP-binding protein